MDSSEIRALNESQDKVRRLTHRTILSLLQSFNDREHRFYPSIEGTNDKPPKSTYRDTALILLAIEEAKNAMSREQERERLQKGNQSVDEKKESQPDNRAKKEQEKKQAWKDFKKAIESNLEAFNRGKLEPIRYTPYRDLIFTEVLNNLSGKKDPASIDNILEKEVENPRPFQDREAFTCSSILSLLNKYPRGKTHDDVYQAALDTVLKALLQPHRPHYIFGGASLTGTEPHTFVAYRCLSALDGLAEVLEKRAEEHEKLAKLLEKISEWHQDEHDAIRRIYRSEKESFTTKTAQRVRLFENAVGLTSVIKALRQDFPVMDESRKSVNSHHSSWRKVLPFLKRRERDVAIPSSRIIASNLVKVLQEQVTEWLTGCSDRVKNQLKEIDDEINDRYTELEKTWKRIKNSADPPAAPGKDTMEILGEHTKTGGILWRRAFFEGIKYVMDQVKDGYAKPNLKKNSPLSDVARQIGYAGKQWEKSAKRTRDYLALLSKWAKAELDRQISLYSRTASFDPVQMAFALRICHDLAPQTDERLMAEALKLVLEAQLPDGTWPPGAPFVFEPQTLAAVYAANLEIMNAVMPLLMKDDAVRYRRYADRVFHWLEVNQRELRPRWMSPAPKIVGWSTDRISEPGRIDHWMTAAALKFLVSYRKLLQNIVNEEIAESYDFSQPQMEWSSVVDAELKREYSTRVTTEIENYYIRPFRETGESSHSSMLLYGPPGTAKSTMAQAIASELGWNLVTITPSDFVKEGMQQSENAARKLFKDLSILREVVVLFDEIDEMLRDRQQEAVKGIEMLRFLIPGMLPKLQTLKQSGEKNRLILIIATNYKENLDSAVLRGGRIDRHFPVVPPDECSRYWLLSGFMKNKQPFKAWPQENDRNQMADFLARKTSGWVYKELEHLVQSLQATGLSTWKDMDEHLNQNLIDKVTEIPCPDWLDGEFDGVKRYKIMRQEASLDPFSFYCRPNVDDDEFERVLCSYGVNDKKTNKKLRDAIIKRSQSSMVPKRTAAA